MNPRRDRVTIQEAVRLTGVSRDTIKRDLEAGRYPGATKGVGGNDPWLIPVADLEAAGRHQPPQGVSFGDLLRERTDQEALTQLRMELAQVRAQLEARCQEVELLRQLLDRLLSKVAV